MLNADTPRWLDDSNVNLERRPEPYLRVHRVPILVRDQDRSLTFYLEQLGFDLIADHRFGEHDRFILVAPPDGGVPLGLLAPKPGSEEHKFLGYPGPHAVFVSQDVLATFETWRARGVRFRSQPETNAWGGVFAFLEDPDGNAFILAGWDAITREIEMQRKALADRLESERRAAQEGEIARQVQARLFPQSVPALPTLECAGICVQARAVGGDYYDFLNFGQGRLGLVIGDISGKGIAAALLMANLQANLRSQFAVALEDPCHFMPLVNRLFYESTADHHYATLFFAIYEDNLKRLRYANCGHMPALLLRNDGNIERLDATGTVVGLFEEWDCAIEERTLSSGDTLLLYTDGVTEACNDAGEEFGEQRLAEALLRNHALPPQAMLEQLVKEIRLFSSVEQADDLTVIVAKWRTRSTV